MDLFGDSPPPAKAGKDNTKVVPLARERGELTRLQTEFVEKAVALYGETALERGDLGFLGTLHANCYLPRGKTDARRYINKNGAYSVLIDAGALMDPATGEWVDQPLPYGGKPRALMAYVNSYAVRFKAQEVPLGNSLTDFVRRMSGEASGGEHGTLGAWKRQMMALAASSMRIGGVYGAPGNGKIAPTRKIEMISELQLWLSPEPNQQSLFPTTIKLSTDYYDQLLEHAMPIDMAALRMLQRDPLAFDLYAWLVYRLPRIRQANGLKLTWKLLYEQFGGDYAVQRQFKARFIAALRKVQVLYPTARIEDVEGGLLLRSSPALVAHVTTVRKLDEIKRLAK